MAKIHFIQDNIINESLGLMCLSSYLKQHDHQVKLTVLSLLDSPEALLAEIAGFDPDLIAFSVMTPQAEFYESIVGVIRKKFKDKKIIWGGAHPTFMPEEALSVVDIICIGEGEESLLQLMNRIASNGDLSQVPSLWFKDDSLTIKTKLAHLEENLDKYPFPDRDLLYSQFPLLQTFALKRFITQRGCPFICNYCFEPMMRNMYRDKGRLVRRHSVEYVLAEIRETLNAYPGARNIHFSDDSFNLNPKWLSDFLPKYKARVNVPFTCNIAVPIVTEERLSALKDAGCHAVIVGLETGNYEIRKNILAKDITNEQYLKLSHLCKKFKLKLVTNNMFKIPTETLDNAIETLKVNKQLGVFCFRPGILKMYKGTNLADTAIKKGLVEAEGRFTFVAKDVNKEHAFFDIIPHIGYFLIKIPFLLNFAKPIITSRFIKYFKFVIIFSYWPDTRIFKIPYLQAWKYYKEAPSIFSEGIGKGDSHERGTQPRETSPD